MLYNINNNDVSLTISFLYILYKYVCNMYLVRMFVIHNITHTLNFVCVLWVCCCYSLYNFTVVLQSLTLLYYILLYFAMYYNICILSDNILLYFTIFDKHFTYSSTFDKVLLMDMFLLCFVQFTKLLLCIMFCEYIRMMVVQPSFEFQLQ